MNLYLNKRITILLRFALLVMLCGALTVGCSSYKVKAPDFIPANLLPPAKSSPPDFVIESVDLIDRSRPIGQVGDKDIMLTESLVDYFEAEAVAELEAKGFRCAKYQGPQSHLRYAEETQTPPLHLRLELQDLAISRHPQRNLFKDNVIGTCKIRGVLFDSTKNLVYQKQFVGLVDTSRPNQSILPSGGRLFSEKGLTSLLSNLLERTVQDFRNRGLDEIVFEHDQYRQFVAESQQADLPTLSPSPSMPRPEPMTPSPTPIPPKAPQESEDVEWVW